MKRIILCEGKTDAILISYFLKKFGWIHVTKSVIGLPVDGTNEVLNWYKHQEKSDQELAIWGVGGIDQIPVKLRYIIERTQNETTSVNRFTRVVIFFDCDDRTEAKCKEMVKAWATDSGLDIIDDLHLGQWLNARIELRKAPPESHELRLLPMVLPPNSQGNLEVFLTNCIRNESENDEKLVDEAEEFISRIPDEPYLSKKRYRSKACLGAILSVMSPDWVFSKLDERITRVNWEEIESAAAVYEKLSDS